MQRESHPVGTTVKVTGLFEHTPVRKQTALKNSKKMLAKTRRLVQAYAFARPHIRFRLRIVKARNNQDDFVYAPKANANVEDAVLKVIGKDCALQCDWTALEADGFEIHAFLPKATATSSKIANIGAFISIDARPVSNSRGTVKQLVTNFKDRLHKSGPALMSVRDPFFCMNIICPAESYDPNIEPAKDDVMFEDGNVVIGIFDKLLKSYYPEIIVEMEDDNLPTSAQLPRLHEREDVPARIQTPELMYGDHTGPSTDKRLLEPISDSSQWRSSMYGVDEEDLEFVQERQAPTIEQEEGLRAADMSNPWTMARMNAPIKPRRLNDNGQLLSPAKSQNGTPHISDSPVTIVTPTRTLHMSPRTPQSAVKTVASQGTLDEELQQSILHLPQRLTRENDIVDDLDRSFMSQAVDASRMLSSEPTFTSHVEERRLRDFSRAPSVVDNSDSASQTLHPPTYSALRQSQRKARSYVNMPSVPPAQDPNDTWFGQPMPGSITSQPPRRQKRSKAQDIPMFTSDIPSSARRPALNVAERVMESRLLTEENTDIRDFFRRDRGLEDDQNRTMPAPLFTSINSPSMNSQLPTMHINDRVSPDLDRATSAQPRSIAEQLRAYAERAAPPRPSTTGTTISMLFDARSAGVSDALHTYGDDSAGPMVSDVVRQSQAYETNSSRLPGTVFAVESEQPSLAHRRSENLETAPNDHRSEKPSHTPGEMEAHFRAIEEREAASSIQHRTEPCNAPTHEHTRKTRRLRPRTTEGLEGTKSSKLPLERIPHCFHIHDLVLPITTSVGAITHSSRKLDMTPNTLEWGYPATENAYDVFAEYVSERQIKAWVVMLDETLHEQYDRLGGVDTRCALHEGIQRGLDARREDEQVIQTRGHGSDLLDSAVTGSVEGKIDDDYLSGVGRHNMNEHVEREDDEMSDFSISQSVDLDAEDSGAVVDKTEDDGVSDVDDEFEDDIEDDMLLDL